MQLVHYTVCYCWVYLVLDAGAFTTYLFGFLTHWIDVLLHWEKYIIPLNMNLLKFGWQKEFEQFFCI